MDEKRLRADLVELLKGGSAHLTWDRALQGLAPKLRAASPGAGLHTIWELLEHTRIAQEDILRYTLDPRWKSPEWPSGYWPSFLDPTDAQWRKSVAGFQRDLKEVVALVRDRKVDLTAPIPHGQGHTALREVLLVADHNAHHLGQVVQARRLLGAWK
ncbi:MAG TPA: DinB family protein [Vicinamibacteria bacterium]|nr:DinB family protein [Vicinamibacteria bacterium]